MCVCVCVCRPGHGRGMVWVGICVCVVCVPGEGVETKVVYESICSRWSSSFLSQMFMFVFRQDSCFKQSTKCPVKNIDHSCWCSRTDLGFHNWKLWFGSKLKFSLYWLERVSIPQFQTHHQLEGQLVWQVCGKETQFKFQIEMFIFRTVMYFVNFKMYRVQQNKQKEL